VKGPHHFDRLSAAPNPLPFRAHVPRGEGITGLLKMAEEDGEIEKEFDGALPYGDDMVGAERLQGVVLKTAFEGMV
jgi:hypothetical protein